MKDEKIQRRVLWVILNDYETTHDDLQKTGQSPMYTSRLRSIVLKIVDAD